MITQQEIVELCYAASIAGFNVNPETLTLLQWNTGLKTHIPLALPKNKAAVYIFKWNNTYLKVGKANAKSRARYQSHHYHLKSSNSNLVKSLNNDTQFHKLIRDQDVGEWIRMNTTRFNILIPVSLGKNFLHFAEAFFILKCYPRFENSRA